MAISKASFGRLRSGDEVSLYTLKNGSETVVSVSDFGATLVNIETPDKNGQLASIVCGFDSLDGYLTDCGYQGATVGRVANRISNAGFTLDGVRYDLSRNHGKHHLHGGVSGFSFKLWEASAYDGAEPKMVFTRISPDGEEGYPGTLQVEVTFTLTRGGALAISYRASTDKKTIVNMTNHSYFNLDGIDKGDIDSHFLTIDSDTINEADNDLIPTGRFLRVDGTPFDFRSPRRISDGFSSDAPMIRAFGGYDNCYVLNGYDATLRKAASVYSRESGRRMTVYTDQPCIQLYTANGIDEGGAHYRGDFAPKVHGSFCLETQKMPDSINHEGFTDVVLMRDRLYEANTVFDFS